MSSGSMDLGQNTGSSSSLIVSSLGNTTALSPTTLVTPGSKGYYSVRFYAVVQVGATSGSLNVTLSWTDTKQVQTYIQSAVVNLGTEGSKGFGTIFVEAIAGEPITISTAVVGAVDAINYDIHAVAELIGR